MALWVLALAVACFSLQAVDNAQLLTMLSLSQEYARVGAEKADLFQTLALLAASRSFTSATYHYTAGFTVNALLMMVLITQLLQLYATPLWSWLEHRIARYLGTISYPMYLYHQWGDSVGRHAASGEGGVFLVGVLATIALASGSYHVVEKPFLRLKGRFHAPVFPTPALPAVVEEATT